VAVIASAKNSNLKTADKLIIILMIITLRKEEEK
jgi:hypothetical protein